MMKDLSEISADDTFLTAIINAIPSGIFVTDLDHNIMMINQGGAKMVGRTPGDCFDRKCYEIFSTPMCGTEDCVCHRTVTDNQTKDGQTFFRIGDKELPVEYSSRPLRNFEGKVIGCVEHFIDISGRLEQERVILEQQEELLQKREEDIRHLQDEILELSTPVIEIWDGILALPLIGTMDSHRAKIAMEKLLEAIERTRAPFILIDITGVPMVDTEVANHIIHTVSAVRLMGSEAILTGVCPRIAQTIAQLGVDMGTIKVRGRMTDALHLAISLLRQKQDKIELARAIAAEKTRV
ncbi:MAG: PAS domain-containing protein [Desulfobulbaceae bacterium]|nr:PAS domain-containing protein [Desulfobulbaceae bacterium]